MPVTPSTYTATLALVITLAIHIFASFASTAVAVLAPEIAADFAISPRLVGVFVGIVYVGSSFGSLLSGTFINRFGAIRVSQVCVLFCAGGLATIAVLPGAWVALLLIVPVVIGIGYGPVTPASSQVLALTTPPSRMAFTFSLKQTGVPAGMALAGALLPLMALTFGWRATFIVVAIAGLIIAITAQPIRNLLDGDRQAGPKVSLGAPRTLLMKVLRHRVLTKLALLGLVYTAAQLCVMSYLVVYLTESLHISLVSAGLALTALSLSGIFARIFWGAIADRWVSPRVMLGLLGCASGSCAYLTAAFDASWSSTVLVITSIFLGATAFGWNGVWLAEIAGQAPTGQAGAVTGAIGFLVFSGVVVGPPSFALLVSIADSYRVGFAVLGTLLLACGLWVLLGDWRSQEAHNT